MDDLKKKEGTQSSPERPSWRRSGKLKGLRLPLVDSEGDVDASSHLSKEEKAMAKENLGKIGASDCYSLIGNDPEALAIFCLIEGAVEALLAPDSQLCCFSPMGLSSLETARQTGCEFFTSSFALCMATGVGLWKNEDTDYRQLSLLEFPDSKVWTDEQRLTIKFTQACCKNTMTNELFNQALETWGEKKTIRLMIWIGFLHIPYIVSNACNLGSHPKFTPPSWGAFNDEAIEAFLQMNDMTLKGMLSLWNSRPAMTTAAQGTPTE